MEEPVEVKTKAAGERNSSAAATNEKAMKSAGESKTSAEVTDGAASTKLAEPPQFTPL